MALRKEQLPKHLSFICFAEGYPMVRKVYTGTSRSGRAYWNCTIKVVHRAIEVDGIIKMQHLLIPFNLWEKQISMADQLTEKTLIRISGKPEIQEYFNHKEKKIDHRIRFNSVYSLVILKKDPRLHNEPKI